MEVDEIIRDAVNNFQSNLYATDAKEVGLLSIQDVLDAVRVIEREREDRDALCNLRRIESVLKELKRLGEAFGRLSDKGHYASYIWGPIKLTLEVANEDDAAFDAILDAYARLATNLAFLEQIYEVTRPADRFNDVIAYTYSDVLDYHKHIYQVLRRGGWRMLFGISWKELAPVFDCVIKRLGRHREFVLQEHARHFKVFESINLSGNATAHLGDQSFQIEHATFVPSEDLATAQRFREKLLEDLEARQKQRRGQQLRECIDWLNLQGQDHDQANLLSRRRDARDQSTCEWILSHPEFQSWLDPESNRQFLWLNGKPGSGKSTLATYIIDHAELPPNSLMIHCLCSRAIESKATDACNLALSVLVAQVLRKNQHLVPYIFETYVKTAEPPSSKLPTILRQLLSCLPGTFIIIDGLDECEPDTQTRLFNKLDWLVCQKKNEPSGHPEVKIFICSQDGKGIPHKLRKQPSISLSKEHTFIARDIERFILNSLDSLHERFDRDKVEALVSEIVDKAEGMFLWVKLVISTLLEQESLYDLRRTLTRLPSGLTGVYSSLLQRIENRADCHQRPRIRIIFYWLVFALRPMKTWEICDALVIGGEGLALIKNSTMLNSGVLDLCKPLIEVHQDHTVSFVHFSVQEYLLHDASGPFVKRTDALHHINLTCLRYLFTCENFFLGTRSPETYRQIVLQAHSLFPYVAKFWKCHFETFAHTSRAKSESTVIFLLRFFREYGHLQMREDERNISSIYQDLSDQHPTRQDPFLICMDSNIVSGSLIECLSTESQSGQPKGKSNPTTGREPNAVDRAFSCFQEQFEHLLNGRCMYTFEDLVSQLELDEFNFRYAKAAFLCRWKICPRSFKGFDNVQERDKHEQGHKLQFRCPEPGCDFEDPGFLSRQALKRHIQRYHTYQDHAQVPRLVLHKRQGATPAESASSHMNEDCDSLASVNSGTSAIRGFTREKLQLLKAQISAFKILSKNMGIPKSLQDRVTPRTGTDHPSTIDQSWQNTKQEPGDRCLSDHSAFIHAKLHHMAAQQNLYQVTGMNNMNSKSQLIDFNLLQYIFQSLFQSDQTDGPFTDWQAHVSLQERAAQIKILFDSLLTHGSTVDTKRALNIALAFEKKYFMQSPSFPMYNLSIHEKLGSIRNNRRPERGFVNY